MKCSDPSTWPEPSAEYTCEDTGYGTVRVRAWAKMHPKVCAHEGRGSRGPLPIVVGTLVLVEVERLPRGERRRKPRVLWLWSHGPEGETPNLELIWRSYVRRFDLEHTFRFLKQALGWSTPRLRHPEQTDRRSIGKEVHSAVSEQAHQRRDDPILLRADGLYYDKGIFDESVVYYDGEAVYFPTRDKDSGTVSFSYVTLETLIQALEE